MISAAARTPVFQKEWFRFDGHYMMPKAEYKDLIEQAWAEQRKTAIAENERLMERLEASHVPLTEDQKRELRESFDLKNMSWEDYQSLVDKLCSYGVLEEEDKKFLHCGFSGLDMSYVDPAAMCTASLQTASVRNPASFASWKGDVLGWAKYLSGFQSWDTDSQSWRKTRESLLFEKLHQLLGAISN